MLSESETKDAPSLYFSAFFQKREVNKSLTFFMFKMMLLLYAFVVW